MALKPDWDLARKEPNYRTYFVKSMIGNMAEIWERANPIARVKGTVSWMGSEGNPFPVSECFCCWMDAEEALPFTVEKASQWERRALLSDSDRCIARYVEAKAAGIVR